MKLIVGLGNPGLKYKNTRHNIGFMFVDRVVDDLGGTFKINSKLKSQICIMDVNGEQVCFCKPITYMNLSGEAVLAVTNYYNIDSNEILIIHDDLDLPTGKIRMREKGSHGGHNGMRNIIDLIKTPNLKRIRIGIDKKPNVIDYVLGHFNKEEMEIIDKILTIAPIMFKEYLTVSFSNLMNKYNQNE